MNPQYKKTGLILVSLLFGCAAASITTAGICDINPGDEKQVIRGFGVSCGSTWTGALSEADANHLFSKATDDQIGLNILRLRIDHSGWTRERDNAYKAQSRGALIMATSWTPPASMKHNNALNNINHAGWPDNWPYTDVANYLGSYVTYMKNAGVNLYAISVQNEPGYPVNYDGAEWNNWNIKDLISQSGNNLAGQYRSHRNIIKANTGVKIMVGETFNNDTSFVDNIFNVYPAIADANIDIVGTHLYEGKHVNPELHDVARAHGKEVWMTEFYLQKPFFPYSSVMDCTVQTMEGVVRAFTQAQMSAWIQWFPEGTYDRILDGNGNVTKLGYGFAQFSKFVENGYHRIATTMSPTPGVYTISFKSNVNNRFVIVAVNRNSTAVPLQQFHFKSGVPAATAKVWTTTENENFKSVQQITMSGNDFKRTLDPRSVTTFVFNY